MKWQVGILSPFYEYREQANILKISLSFGCPFWNISNLFSFSDILHYRKTQSVAGTKKKLCGPFMVMAPFPCEDIQWALGVSNFTSFLQF